MVRVNPQISEFSRSHNSFSGVDIKATFANRTIGEIQAISYSITREKAPIYTLGSADPRAFSRGKRGIAGTLIFITFDRHALLEELRDLKFQSDKDDVKPEWRFGDNNLNFPTAGNAPSTPVGGGIANNPAAIQQESDLLTVDSDQEVAHPWYSDQVPPFDITLAAANEYGALAVMRIFGVEILNEGYGISIDDLVSEQQMTYIARTLLPWQWVRPNDYFVNPPNGQSL